MGCAVKGPSCQFSDNSNVSLSSLELLATMYARTKAELEQCHFEEYAERIQFDLPRFPRT